MDYRVRQALIRRIEDLDRETEHMAEDIVGLRKQLEDHERQLVRMNSEREALAEHINNRSET